MNDLAQAIIILNRRKKQVLEELEEAQPKLLIWSKRLERMKTNILEIEEELDIEEEIKLIKNFLKCATSALEKLESKVLKYKENKKSFNIINVDDELEIKPNISGRNTFRRIY